MRRKYIIAGLGEETIYWKWGLLMTDQLSPEELATLAEFVELKKAIEYRSNYYYVPDNIAERVDYTLLSEDKWEPDSILAPQWQIQMLLDAVREKELEHKYKSALYDLVAIRFGDNTDQMLLAPPITICRAVLEVINDDSHQYF